MPLASGTLETDKKSGFIPSKKFPAAIFDILSGLEELHILEMYHRDLKPSNVLRFTDVDGISYYALSDFGLMSIQQKTGITMLTSVTMAKSSDFYTAPELTQHLSNANASTDLYSAACIIDDFVGSGNRSPCYEINNNSSYCDILSIATRKDANKRFKSVSSFRDALLTVESEDIGPKTEINNKLSKYLSDKNLDDEQLAELINFLQDDNEDKYERLNVLLKIDLDHINSIKNLPNKVQFAMIYCDTIKQSSFQFEYCDALASRLDALIDGEGINVQAHGVMALLFLGTNHNRFHVERKFISKVGLYMDTKLANRLRIEFNLEEERICDAINHLTYSIKYSTKYLHPIIREAYIKICKKNTQQSTHG